MIYHNARAHLMTCAWAIQSGLREANQREDKNPLKGTKQRWGGSQGCDGVVEETRRSNAHQATSTSDPTKQENPEQHKPLKQDTRWHIFPLNRQELRLHKALIKKTEWLSMTLQDLQHLRSKGHALSQEKETRQNASQLGRVASLTSSPLAWDRLTTDGHRNAQEPIKPKKSHVNADTPVMKRRKLSVGHVAFQSQRMQMITWKRHAGHSYTFPDWKEGRTFRLWEISKIQELMEVRWEDATCLSPALNTLLPCLLPRYSVNFLSDLSGDFEVNNGGDFWWISVVSVSQEEENESPSNFFQGKFGAKVGATFGTVIRKFGELSFCNLPDLTNYTSGWNFRHLPSAALNLCELPQKEAWPLLPCFHTCWRDSG